MLIYHVRMFVMKQLAQQLRPELEAAVKANDSKAGGGWHACTHTPEPGCLGLDQRAHTCWLAALTISGRWGCICGVFCGVRGGSVVVGTWGGPWGSECACV